ncbi:MAG: C40 family peptidase [Clostridia bacterium]|nr:C40 family peptidase [Clostridia bacterium]
MRKRIIQIISILTVLAIMIVPISALAESTVKKGSKGTDVKRLQLMLNIVDDQSLEADGVFGTKTVTAVRAFQKEHSLGVDGIAGKKTWSKLNSLYDKLQVNAKKGRVSLSSGKLNFRDRPTTSSKVLTKLADGKNVNILKSRNGFYAVSVDGMMGFVSQKYVTVLNSSEASKLDTLIKTVKGFEGNPYSMAKAGTLASNGKMYTDCSYMMQYSFAKVGISLPRTAAEQARFCDNLNLNIKKSQLSPGDLIFYSTAKNGRYRNITHVGMYIGDGYMIDASASKGKVIIRKIWGTPLLYCNTSDII